MYPLDGILTSAQKFHDVESDHLIEAESSGDCFDVSPDHQFQLIITEELNTMITGEDEPSSGLNGRLRPRKSTIHSPQIKSIRKTEGKIAQDKPKRTSTPSKASPNKPDDLGNKSDSLNAPQLLCPYCDKKFANRQTVSQHIRRTHLSTTKNELFLGCLFCNHNESEANDIIRHMVDSHPNQYFACLDCHTRFSSTSDLAEHKLNVCEKQKPSYRSKLRQKASFGAKKNQKRISIDSKNNFHNDGKEFPDGHAFNGIVISCELKPSQVHDEADIEHNITTNVILPPSKTLGSTVIEKNAVIVLDDIHWNKRIPPNFSFHNTDADQILSRLGVVHRSPRTGESTRRDWFKAIDDSTQKFEKCFDTAFYSKVASNVQENLTKFLDGSFNFNPDAENTIKTRKSKNSVAINTAEGFPILLACEQYSRNIFDGSMPRAIAPKHKWKWDNLENDKSLMNPDQIKRDTHVNNCIITLVSSLDIWTQLCMRRKFEEKFGYSPLEKKTEKRNIVGMELKEILESREIPTSSTQVIKYASHPVPNKDGLDFPGYLGLAPAAPAYQLQPAVLSGEWVRPRCYVCCACGAQTRDSRALSSHISMQHPNAQVQHYEIVGEPLIKAGISKHLYVPPSQMCNRTRPLRGFRDCTKCGKSITLEDLHQHMLDCAGDAPAVRRKCRYRPFGVRRRRPRLPDNTIRQKIRKDIRTRQRQKGHLRPRPIRTDVGDAETIRKMIADLPAKRHRVIANPLKPILRSRKIFDKQRNKLMMKRRSSEDPKHKKPRVVKDSNNASDNRGTNDDIENNTIFFKDNDDEPLIVNMEREPEKAKNPTDSYGKIMESQRPDINTQSNFNNQKLDVSGICPNDMQAEQPPIHHTPENIDINGGPYNVREHGNSNSNNRNDHQQPGDNRQNVNQENNNAPAQNAPLKHSIARLTANSETHDKSVQFHHSFLIQQECNNVTQNIHIPGDRKQVFEDEDAVIKLDKPPLQIDLKEPPNHCTAAQKSKLMKSRRLNNCITILRNKLVEPTPSALPVGRVSVQCGDDEPLDPDPMLPVQILAQEIEIDSSPAQVFSRLVLKPSTHEKMNENEFQQPNDPNPFEESPQRRTSKENNVAKVTNLESNIHQETSEVVETDTVAYQCKQLKDQNEASAIPKTTQPSSVVHSEYGLPQGEVNQNVKSSNVNKINQEKVTDLHPENATNLVQLRDSNKEIVTNPENQQIFINDNKETGAAKKSSELHFTNALTKDYTHSDSHKRAVNFSESNYMLNRYDENYLQNQARLTATELYSQYSMSASMSRHLRCDNENDIYTQRMNDDYLQSQSLQNLTEESSYSSTSGPMSRDLHKRVAVNAIKDYTQPFDYDNLRSTRLDKSAYINHDSYNRAIANFDTGINKRHSKYNKKQNTALSTPTKVHPVNGTTGHIRRNSYNRSVANSNGHISNQRLNNNRTQSKSHQKLIEVQSGHTTSSKYKRRDSYERDIINVGSDMNMLQSAMQSSNALMSNNIRRNLHINDLANLEKSCANKQLNYENVQYNAVPKPTEIPHVNASTLHYTYCDSRDRDAANAKSDNTNQQYLYDNLQSKALPKATEIQSANPSIAIHIRHDSYRNDLVNADSDINNHELNNDNSQYKVLQKQTKVQSANSSSLNRRRHDSYKSSVANPESDINRYQLSHESLLSEAFLRPTEVQGANTSNSGRIRRDSYKRDAANLGNDVIRRQLNCHNVQNPVFPKTIDIQTAKASYPRARRDSYKRVGENPQTDISTEHIFNYKNLQSLINASTSGHQNLKGLSDIASLIDHQNFFGNVSQMTAELRSYYAMNALNSMHRNSHSKAPQILTQEHLKDATNASVSGHIPRNIYNKRGLAKTGAPLSAQRFNDHSLQSSALHMLKEVYSQHTTAVSISEHIQHEPTNKNLVASSESEKQKYTNEVIQSQSTKKSTEVQSTKNTAVLGNSSYTHNKDGVGIQRLNDDNLSSVVPPKLSMEIHSDTILSQKIKNRPQCVLKASQPIEESLTETCLEDHHLRETNEYTNNILSEQIPIDSHHSHDSTHKVDDKVCSGTDSSETSVEIPPAHASTNVDSILSSPLDLSGRYLTMTPSDPTVQENLYDVTDYVTYETLDLSHKTSKETDEIVDLRVKCSEQTVCQPSTLSLPSNLSKNDNVTDLSVTECDDEYNPTDLSMNTYGREVPGHTDQDAMYDVGDLSDNADINVEEEIDEYTEPVIDKDSPTDLSYTTPMSLSNSQSQETPSEISENLIEKHYISTSIADEDNMENNDLPTERPTPILSGSPMAESSPTDSNVLNKDYNINVQASTTASVETHSKMLQKPIYEPSLEVPRYESRVLASTSATTNSGLAEDSNPSNSASLPLTWESDSNRPLRDPVIVDTPTTNPLIEIPDKLSNAMQDSDVLGIDTACTLPDSGQTSSLSEFESASSVCTLANACTSATISDSTSGNTNNLPTNTETSTATVHTSTGTSNNASVNNSPNSGAEAEQAVIDEPIADNENAINDNEPTDGVNEERNEALANAVADQDAETARKIALLPKELVDILGTMPVDHRKQLLNILPQYVSASTATPRCEASELINASASQPNRTISTSAASTSKTTPTTTNDTQQKSEDQIVSNANTTPSPPHDRPTESSLIQSTKQTNFNLSEPTVAAPPSPSSLPSASTSTEPQSNIENEQPAHINKTNDCNLEITKNESDNFLIDPYTGTMDQRIRGINECDDRVMDFTEPVTMPNISTLNNEVVKLDENLPCPISMQSQEMTDGGILKTNIKKVSNDQTASLRAVRIKTPSVRNKTAIVEKSMLEKNTGEQTLKLHVMPPEDCKEYNLPTNHKFSAIQQIQVTSTVCSTRNIILDSKSPMSIASGINTENVKPQKIMTPSDIIVAEKNESQHIDIENASVKSALSNLGSKKHNDSHDFQNINKDKTVSSKSTPQNDFVVKEALSLKDGYTKEFQSNNPKQNEEQIIIQSPNGNISDDSEDDVSLAVILQQKQQRDQKNIVHKDNKQSVKGSENNYLSQNKNLGITDEILCQDLSNQINTDLSQSKSIVLETKKKPYTNKFKVANLEDKHAESNENGMQDNLATRDVVNKQSKTNYFKDGDKNITEAAEQQLEAVQIGVQYEHDIDKENDISSDSLNVKKLCNKPLMYEQSSRVHSTDNRIQKRMDLNEHIIGEDLLEVPMKPNENMDADELSTLPREESHSFPIEEISYNIDTKQSIISTQKYTLKSKNTNETLSKANNDLTGKISRSEDENLNVFKESNTKQQNVQIEKTNETVIFESSTHKTPTINKTQDPNFKVDNSAEKTSTSVSDLENKINMALSKTQNNEHSFETSLVTDLKLHSEIEETTVTPLRRSRRGKSMFVDSNINLKHNDIVHPESTNEHKTPLTKKQLIFSKMLLDGENHSVPPAHSTPEKNATNVYDNSIANNVSIVSAQISDIDSSGESDMPSKRRKSQLKQNCKKNKYLDNPQIFGETSGSLDTNQSADTNKILIVKNKYCETTDSNTDSVFPEDKAVHQIQNVNRDKNIDFGVTPNRDSTKARSSDKETENVSNIESTFSYKKLTSSTEKRKLSDVLEIEAGDNLIPKKIKINDKNIVVSDINIEAKEKVNNEPRTACYNMPIAAKKFIRSKSVVVKSSGTEFYDPYDIDLDDMIEKAEPFKRLSSQKTVHRNHILKNSHSKKVKSKKSIKVDHSISVDAAISQSTESQTQQAIDHDLHRRQAEEAIGSDSDDSSKSDVPLQKYKEKQKKSMRRKRNERFDEKLGGKLNKKSRRTLAVFNKVDSMTVPNETEEQLRSEQFMESFGFFSERKPRKSNLLASKKISETFHLIANVSDDVYFGFKQRSTKRTLQNENRKSGGNNSKSVQYSPTKKVIKRGQNFTKKFFNKILPKYCVVCKKDFQRPDNFLRHQMTLLHISKLSELEMKFKTFPMYEEPNYLIPFKQQIDKLKILKAKLAKQKKKSKNRPKKLPTIKEIVAKVQRTVRERQLAQRGLSRDEALFIDCCELLKSHTNDVNNVDTTHRTNNASKFIVQTSVNDLDLLGKRIGDDKYDTRSDGDVDSITAKNILESEEVRNLENDLISGLKEAANASSLNISIVNYQHPISDVGNKSFDETKQEHSNNNAKEYHLDIDLVKKTSKSKVKKQAGTKEKMYPDIENIDLFEDKFDKIKRKCRSQAAAAKQIQPIVEPKSRCKGRKKSDKKKSKKCSKKNYQTSQVPTKGALKGFDGIKVSIPTSDINMAAIVANQSPQKRKKKNNSKRKRDKKDTESSGKYEHDNRANDNSPQKNVDVYEFMDNDDAELFEFRPSTLMERFKSISNKEAPSTSKSNHVVEEPDISNDSVSDGDDFVYMSDDYVCSDDETENSLLSCEFGNSKVVSDIKKNTSLLKRKDAVEKNAVMGKIFKPNAVRSEKKIEKCKDSAKPKANLDQLFDSLLEDEPSSSMLKNDAVSPSKDDLLSPKKSSKYEPLSIGTTEKDESLSLQKFSTPYPKDYELSPKKHTLKKYSNLMDLGPSTSKCYDELNETVDFGPSTSRHQVPALSRGYRDLFSKKYDSQSSKRCETITSERYITSPICDNLSPSRSNDELFTMFDSKEKQRLSKQSPSKKFDEGISTSYDYSAEVDDEISKYDDSGVARQRARRKCTVGKQNILAETWSSESEPDGIPPRPTSAESVLIGVGRKRKGRKKDGHQSGGRRNNNRHGMIKKHDIDSRVFSSKSSSGTGGSRDCGGSLGSEGDRKEVRAHVFGAPAPRHGSTLGSHRVRSRPTTSYWSSEGDDEQEHQQQHGWIVGDSHKKLVTMLAHAKGRKRHNDDKRHQLE